VKLLREDCVGAGIFFSILRWNVGLRALLAAKSGLVNQLRVCPRCSNSYVPARKQEAQLVAAPPGKNLGRELGRILPLYLV
jgi:hypothetical protein